MKVAVACMDEYRMSSHFGRSACFIKYHLENGRILESEMVVNNAGCGSRGGCHGHGHDDDHAPHSHKGLVDLLGDCEAVICGGMGPGAAQDLVSRGIKPVVIGRVCSPEQAVLLYESGQLTPGQSGDCCHGKNHSHE